MRPLGQLVLDLFDALPGADQEPGDLRVHRMHLQVPVETRMAPDALRGELPRNRLQTGFSIPVSTLRARFERGES